MTSMGFLSRTEANGVCLGMSVKVEIQSQLSIGLLNWSQVGMNETVSGVNHRMSNVGLQTDPKGGIKILPIRVICAKLTGRLWQSGDSTDEHDKHAYGSQ